MKRAATVEMMWFDGACKPTEACASLKNDDAKKISEGRSDLPVILR
jgi:hypothetical protein